MSSFVRNASTTGGVGARPTTGYRHYHKAADYRQDGDERENDAQFRASREAHRLASLSIQKYVNSVTRNVLALIESALRLCMCITRSIMEEYPMLGEERNCYDPDSMSAKTFLVTLL